MLGSLEGLMRKAVSCAVVSVAFATMTASNILAFECPGGSDQVLKLLAWSVEDTILPNAAKLAVSYENISDRRIQMIEAITWLADPLDRIIGGIEVSPDLEIAAGGVIDDSAGNIFDRIELLLQPDKISAITCTTAVLYSDGEIVRFN